MKTHKIKIKEGYFDEILQGNKTCEIRFNDRDYQVDDTVVLCEVDNLNLPTLREQKIRITHVLSGWGLKENYVALSFKKNP